MKMRRASYRRAVELIGLNDDPDVLDGGAIAGTMTVGLVADLFGVDVARVARDVARFRKREARAKVGDALGRPGHRARKPRGADRVVGPSRTLGTVAGVEIVGRGPVQIERPNSGAVPACGYCAGAISTDGPAPPEGTTRTCAKCGRVWTFKKGTTSAGGRMLEWTCPKRTS